MLFDSNEHGRKRSLLSSHRVLSAYKRNPNLRDALVSSKLKGLPTRRTRNVEAPFKRLHSITAYRRAYRTASRASPQSSNCVYLLRCRVCGHRYVGETGRRVIIRWREHRRNADLGHTNTPLLRHCRLHGFHRLVLSVLEHNPTWNAAARRRRERLWITRLRSLAPLGLNER